MNKEMKITYIGVGKIFPSPNQPRQKITKVQVMAANIKKNGLINPISVEIVSAKKFSIISGERRFRAMVFLQWKKIPCIIRDRTKWDALAENFCREDLNIVEKAQAINTLLLTDFGKNYASLLSQISNKDCVDWTKEGKEIFSVCQSIGYSPNYIYQVTKVLNISKKLQPKLIKEGVNSQVVLKLATIKDEKIQEKIFLLISKGCSDAEVIQQINAEKFLEAKNISNSVDNIKELFKAYQNFNRGTSHLRSAIPKLVGLPGAIGKVKRKNVLKNSEALLYLLVKLDDPKFIESVRKVRSELEELSGEMVL